jgi:nicotinamidase-related amidase
MPEAEKNIEGSEQTKSDVAILLIDWINDLEFPGGDKLLKAALPAAESTAALKIRAKAVGVPIIYVNDNFGHWQSDFRKLLAHCLQDKVCGKPIAELLKPEPDDYFVLKPKHSAFFSTTLNLLLEYLEVRKLILTGLTGDICVLFTANDAYMRDYQLFVPADCVASLESQDNQQALDYMARVLKAEIQPSTKITFDEMTKSLKEKKTRAASSPTLKQI